MALEAWNEDHIEQQDDIDTSTTTNRFDAVVDVRSNPMLTGLEGDPYVTALRKHKSGMKEIMKIDFAHRLFLGSDTQERPARAIKTLLEGKGEHDSHSDNGNHGSPLLRCCVASKKHGNRG